MIPPEYRDAGGLYTLGVSITVADIEDRIPAMVLGDLMQIRSELVPMGR